MLTTLLMEVVLTIGLQATGATPVAGNEPLPADVRTALGTIAKNRNDECKRQGGAPRADVKRLMFKVDLNQDGLPDYLIDENGFTCQSPTYKPCEFFCTLHVLLSYPEGYVPAGNPPTTLKWHIVERDGAPAIASAHKNHCDEAGNECDYYDWSWEQNVLLPTTLGDLMGDYSLACKDPRAARFEIRRDGLTRQDRNGRRTYRNVQTFLSSFGKSEPPPGYLLLMHDEQFNVGFHMFKDRNGPYAAPDWDEESSIPEAQKWRRCGST